MYGNQKNLKEFFFMEEGGLGEIRTQTFSIKEKYLMP